MRHPRQSKDIGSLARASTIALLAVHAVGCDPGTPEQEELAPIPSSFSKADEIEEDRGVPSDEALDDLARLSAAEIEETFANGVVDRIPHGVGYGRSIVLPQSDFANGKADELWYGKTFDADGMLVVNRTVKDELFRAAIVVDSLAGFLDREVPSIAYHFAPWKTFPEDGNPSIIVDYSAGDNPEAPFISSLLVDQVRRVWTDQYDNLYLGRLMIRTPFGPQLTNYFALSFPDSRPLDQDG